MVEHYTVKTPNFRYILNIEPIKGPMRGVKIYVGNLANPCLEASLYVPDPEMDMRFIDILHICKLHKTEALQECALEYDTDKSFGTELLYSFIYIVQQMYPHVTEIQLSDASHIPCNRSIGDTLDLLTYSVALYGKTWYELKSGAHTLHNRNHRRYYDGVAEYIKPETKASMSYTQFIKYIAIGNPTTYSIISMNPTYESMYNSAKTFPEFFRSLSKTVPNETKCKFFKGWLEAFIENYVFIMREWTIELKQNSILDEAMVHLPFPILQRISHSGGKRLSRKARRRA